MTKFYVLVWPWLAVYKGDQKPSIGEIIDDASHPSDGSQMTWLQVEAETKVAALATGRRQYEVRRVLAEGEGGTVLTTSVDVENIDDRVVDLLKRIVDEGKAGESLRVEAIGVIRDVAISALRSPTTGSGGTH